MESEEACCPNLPVTLLQELTSHTKPKGRTTQPTQTQLSSMPRADTTTQTRRRSIISKLERPGETGGDAGFLVVVELWES